MRSPLSILFGPLPPPFGGVAVFMTEVGIAAMERGVQVWSYKGRPKDFDGPNFRHVNHRRFGHLIALMREGRGTRITDSTHFHLEYPNLLLLPLWICLKFFLRFTWLKIVHDGSLPSRYADFGFLSRALFNLAVGRIDQFIVGDRNLERWLRDEIGVSQPITFIQIPLPTTTDWGNSAPNESLTAQLERFSQHKKRVCSIGVFIPSYGFQDVAEAIDKMREQTGDDIGLLLVDGCFARDEGYRSKALLGRDWIETVENVPHPLIPHIFRQSDVFVRAFAHESYGLARIEAIWCGTPVIATNVGETRGMLLYDFGDIGQLSEHLKKVFAGDAAGDISNWAITFHGEARKNLERYLNVITGEIVN